MHLKQKKNRLWLVQKISANFQWRTNIRVFLRFWFKQLFYFLIEHRLCSQICFKLLNILIFFFIILLYIFIGIRTFILSFSVLVQFYIKYFLAFQTRLVFFSSFFTITDNYCFQWNGYHFWLFVIKLFLNYECKI